MLIEFIAINKINEYSQYMYMCINKKNVIFFCTRHNDDKNREIIHIFIPLLSTYPYVVDTH